MYQDLHFYIDLSWENYADNQADIYQLVQFAYQHKATVFYSQSQITEFNKNCEELDDEYITSQHNKLEILLKDAICKKDAQYAFEICFANENTTLRNITNSAIASINAYNNNALLSFNQNEKSKELLSVKSQTSFEKIEFDILNKLSDIHQWIISKITPRKFNLSDKHGENGKGNWKGESVLLCDKHEAQILLNEAIPDFYEKEERLFNFDTLHQTFLEFYFEGDNPQNQWHGFHIKKEDWNKRVPPNIRKYFGKP